MKRIAIMTTGGDCSGLNATIRAVTIGAHLRGHKIIGILDGTDGLFTGAKETIKLTSNTLSPEMARISGSILRNGDPKLNIMVNGDNHAKIRKTIQKTIAELKLDSIILIGGNGSLSLAHNSRDIYGNIQLIGIPKTIDMDVPLTDITIGFTTAVRQTADFCAQLLLTARSHHRWFVVQSMGRNSGMLTLHSGIAAQADAILIPEIKWSPAKLIQHIESINRDYGIIIVSEGVTLRGHSGKPADIVARELAKRGITVRTSFPEHFQRVGDASAIDRTLAAQFANCALDAIDNGETYMMTAMQNGAVKTISLEEMFKAGVMDMDPGIKNLTIVGTTVPDDYPLLSTAANMGVYIGETR
jgi:6-phosphofructokinase 1